MTNPSNLTPGPDHVADPHIHVGETVSSISPKVTLGLSKAVAGGVAGTAIGFLGALSTAYADEVVTGGEWISVGIATILAATAAFGITWAVPTKVTAN